MITITLGTKVLYYETPAIVVSHKNNMGMFLIATNTKPTCWGWDTDSYNYTDLKKSFIKSISSDDIKNYKWYWWVQADDSRCVLDDIIISPNQVCIGCNLLSPHVKPNINDKFVCVACRFLADLDGVALGG